MGLLQKRKAAIERAKAEQLHDIVCRYCFRSFKHSRVLFRAAEVIGAEGYHAAIDQPLDKYRACFQMDSIGKLPVVLDPEAFREINKGYRHGVLSSLMDNHNNISTRRLCPYCHNDIPHSAGFAPSTIISLVGAGQAGKSVYLAALIHTIKTVTSRNFEVFCAPLTSEIGRRFKLEYEDPLITNGCLPEMAQSINAPLVFTFSFADDRLPELNIALFDIAGGLGDCVDMYQAYIRNSSGVLLLVDPQQFREVGRKMHSHIRLRYDVGASYDPVEILGGIPDVPVAVVLTKADLLQSLSYEGGYIHPKSSIFTRYNHRGRLNLFETDIINYEVEDFIRRVDSNFHNSLSRRFSNLGFFAVSALGAHPEAIRQRVAGFAPARVEEPFLWTLYMLGYINGYHEGAGP